MMLLVKKTYALYISKRIYNKDINFLFWDGQYSWIKHFVRLVADTAKYVFLWLVLLLKFIVNYFSWHHGQKHFCQYDNLKNNS